MPIIVAIDPPTNRTIARSGAASRVFCALSQHTEGLSIEEICQITGLAKSTAYAKGVRSLFNLQILEEVRDANVRVYRLKATSDISVEYDSRKRSVAEK